ncbi:hypothetical protein LTR37_004541 [Vermiconidia calcicola]|uniref:Uncharacterized protein n=1 Tax=Vermiconidia calcicola TaxID=1690605 RepID=A0ACC3NN17_9PEZI|nr:hypothetical protein LTR37_004541 [Vermiconidia calcicola]
MLPAAWRCLLSSSCLSLWAASTCRADEQPYLRNKEYNEAEYGRYVTQKFKTVDIEAPLLNFMRPFTDCDDGSYIFVSPRGNVPDATFYILDHEGSLVWGPDHHYGEVYNFQVQIYKGEPYLFFWAGDDSIGGHGEGKYYMLDKHYEEHKKISAGDGIRGDLHAFTITDENTAVFTAYQVVPYDLTELGRPADSWIWESLFQELDIETGEVIFEWRASEHFPFLDAYVNPNKATRNDPWDFFHINMVEKDADGNYLVSTRYGRCVLYVDGKSGEILWRLGGKANSFKDLSDGQATVFLGQHDAHWSEGHKYITMFDNRADWFHKIEDESKGHKIEVDLDKMTAKLVHSYTHPDHILSTSQGSMQILPNGNVFMGYGFNGVWTEYTPEGEALCDAYMIPSKRFGSGDVQSYRVLKSNWTGIPLTTPDIAYESGTLYMSWLGSTKLRQWLLQDCDTADGLFESVQTTPKRGFETVFNLKDGKRMRQYVRAIAVDEGGTQLSISNPVDLLDPHAIWGDKNKEEEQDHGHGHEHGHGNNNDGHASMREDLEDVQILLVLGILAIISAVLVAFMTFGCRCMPFKRMQRNMAGEKGEAGIMSFRDDGKLRTAWNKVRSSFPGGSKKSWARDFPSSAGGLLRYGQGYSERDSVEAGAEMTQSHTDFDDDDRDAHR